MRGTYLRNDPAMPPRPHHRHREPERAGDELSAVTGGPRADEANLH